MRIVGIAGSLRTGSFNKMLLAAVADALPADVSFETIDLAGLPLYNADEERGGPPAAVLALRDTVRAADGLLIATPEYNQGLPAATKNAIDWLSRRPKPHPLEAKPVGVMGATPGRYATRRAQADLRHVLAVLGAYTMVRPWLMIAHARDRFADDGRPDEPLQADIGRYSASFVNWVARFS